MRRGGRQIRFSSSGKTLELKMAEVQRSRANPAIADSVCRPKQASFPASLSRALSRPQAIRNQGAASRFDPRRVRGKSCDDELDNRGANLSKVSVKAIRPGLPATGELVRRYREWVRRNASARRRIPTDSRPLNAVGSFHHRELQHAAMLRVMQKLNVGRLCIFTHLFRHHAAAVVIFLCAWRIHAPYH